MDRISRRLGSQADDVCTSRLQTTVTPKDFTINASQKRTGLRNEKCFCLHCRVAFLDVVCFGFLAHSYYLLEPCKYVFGQWHPRAHFSIAARGVEIIPTWSFINGKWYINTTPKPRSVTMNCFCTLYAAWRGFLPLTTGRILLRHDGQGSWASGQYASSPSLLEFPYTLFYLNW